MQKVSRSKARRLRDRRVAVRQALCKSCEIKRQIPFMSARTGAANDALLLAAPANYSGLAWKLDAPEHQLTSIYCLLEHVLLQTRPCRRNDNYCVLEDLGYDLQDVDRHVQVTSDQITSVGVWEAMPETNAADI